MRLYSQNGLYDAIQPLFAEGCGVKQFNAIVKLLPCVDIPGRKHPMYDFEAVVDLLRSGERAPLTPDSSLHRRRGDKTRLPLSA